MAVRDPQIEIRELEEDRIEFVLSNTDTSVANAIRRVMMAEVKTMCIERVDFYKNTTVLTDEFLAHRLGLMPLNYRYNLDYLSYCAGPETDMLGTLGHRFMDNRECECGDKCYRCCVTFELNVKFEHDEAPGVREKLVTSRDLVAVALVEGAALDDVQPVHFSNANDRDSAHDAGVLLVKLARGQELHLVATAILGVGKEHAKWCPTSQCSFVCEPIVEPNAAALDALSDRDRAAVRDSCPVGVFGDTSRSLQADGVTVAADPGQALVALHPEKCMYCGECTAKCAELTGAVDHDLLVVKSHENKFVFSVETTGALAPEDVVQQALHVVRKKILRLQEEVQEKMDDEQAQNAGQFAAAYQNPM